MMKKRKNGKHLSRLPHVCLYHISTFISSVGEFNELMMTSKGFWEYLCRAKCDTMWIEYRFSIKTFYGETTKHKFPYVQNLIIPCSVLSNVLSGRSLCHILSLLSHEFCMLKILTIEFPLERRMSTYQGSFDKSVNSQPFELNFVFDEDQTTKFHVEQLRKFRICFVQKRNGFPQGALVTSRVSFNEKNFPNLNDFSLSVKKLKDRHERSGRFVLDSFEGIRDQLEHFSVSNCGLKLSTIPSKKLKSLKLSEFYIEGGEGLDITGEKFPNLENVFIETTFGNCDERNSSIESHMLILNEYMGVSHYPPPVVSLNEGIHDIKLKSLICNSEDIKFTKHIDFRSIDVSECLQIRFFHNDIRMWQFRTISAPSKSTLKKVSIKASFTQLPGDNLNFSSEWVVLRSLALSISSETFERKYFSAYSSVDGRDHNITVDGCPQLQYVVFRGDKSVLEIKNLPSRVSLNLYCKCFSSYGMQKIVKVENVPRLHSLILDGTAVPLPKEQLGTIRHLKMDISKPNKLRPSQMSLFPTRIIDGKYFKNLESFFLKMNYSRKSTELYDFIRGFKNLNKLRKIRIKVLIPLGNVSFEGMPERVDEAELEADEGNDVSRLMRLYSGGGASGRKFKTTDMNEYIEKFKEWKR